jgi:hypothetical protein
MDLIRLNVCVAQANHLVTALEDLKAGDNEGFAVNNARVSAKNTARRLGEILARREAAMLDQTTRLASLAHCTGANAR